MKKLSLYVIVAGLGLVARLAGASDVRFSLSPSPDVVRCLAAFPDDPSRPPTAIVRITREEQNDILELRVKNVKPHLGLDLFTVERSRLLSDGSIDPAFHGFGLAWYQSDIGADREGRAFGRIRTILLDSIFGFDPDVKLPPTNTFHVGLWFDDPEDAADCGFDASKPTPFNEEHKAGPVAMISVPDAETGLGPLCTNPDTSVTPARCLP